MTSDDPTRDADELLSRAYLGKLMPKPGEGVAGDLSAELAAARLCASLCDEPVELLLEGRYKLQKEIGAGGIGVVYRAYDPMLERDVAIKILQSRSASDDTQVSSQRDRLLAEARTLAKLRDPHVVPVFEVGTHRGEVYMVMELVEGLDLGVWVKLMKPATAEIVGAYAQAGRGLASAHKHGIIHRDFKPANARRDNNGHVRVLDFGLAAHGELSARSELEGPTADAALPRSSGLVGTPRYMAPEQHDAEASPASDQYSFCLALYEAVTGTLPPSRLGADSSARHERRRSLPRWLARVLQRGLDPDPARRYRSMSELLDELERDRGTRALMYTSIIVVTLTSAGVAMFSPPPAPAPGPSPFDQCVASSEGAWSSAQGMRARVTDVFTAAEEHYSRDTLDRVNSSLDAYIEEWRASFKRACAQTHRERTQSPALLDRRLECLERRREAVHVMLERLAGAEDEPGLRRDAAWAVAALPGVSSCDDVQQRPEVEPPTAEQQPAVAELERELRDLEIDSLLIGEEPADTSSARLLRRADELTADAEAIAYGPTLARAHFARGQLRRIAGRASGALDDFSIADHQAETTGDDVVVIGTLHERARVKLLLAYDAEAGAELLARARAKLDRVGADGLLRAVQRDLEGHVAYQQARYADAIALHGDAIARYQALPVYEARIGLQRAYVNLGRALSQDGQVGEALAAYKRSYELGEDIVGAGHPALTDTRYNHGVAMLEAGALDQALVLFQWVRDDEARFFGERSLKVAMDEHAIGMVLLQRRMLDDALRHVETELSIVLEHPDANAITRAAALDLAGGLSTDLGALDQADDYIARAREQLRGSTGDPRLRSVIERHAGELALARSQPERALELFTRASDILREAETPRGADHANITYERARVYTALARPRDAIREFETALEIWAEQSDNPTGEADVKTMLAAALVRSSPADRPRACRLAREARDYFVRDAKAHQRALAETAAWIGAHCEAATRPSAGGSEP